VVNVAPSVAVEVSPSEIGRAIALDAKIAEEVAGVHGAGAFPLVSARECNSALGTVAGLGPGRTGVVWFDAHADFDTTEDNLSGYFDVFALSVLTGTGWRALRETIPGFAPLPEADVVLAGVRDLEPYQRARLEASEVVSVPGEIDLEALGRAVDLLAARVDQIYLHLDVDVMDVSEGRFNIYAAPGGPSLEHMLEAVRLVFARSPVAAAALTAYDASVDGDGRAGRARERMREEVRRLAETSSGSANR
jgi:arginase